MKKAGMVFIIVVLVIMFLGLVRYGLSRARGVPVAETLATRPVLAVPSMGEECDLTGEGFWSPWEGLAPLRIKLMHQVMVFPWPKAVTPFVMAKAFRNKKEIYFHLEWPDETRDDVLDLNRFTDAGAVMFPLGEETQPSSLMMGFLGRANIWQWKASQDQEFWQQAACPEEAYSDFRYPFEEQETLAISRDAPVSAVNDLIAVRIGSVTPKPRQEVSGRGRWQEGKWQVVFKRSLAASDTEIDASFPAGSRKLCAFAVWNGSKGERGGRKSISDWVTLEVR